MASWVPEVLITGLALTGGGGLVLIGWQAFGAPLWYARRVGVRMDWAAVAGMRLRGVPPRLIVDTAAELEERGHPMSPVHIEAAYLMYRGRPLTAEVLAELIQRDMPIKPMDSDARV